MPNNTRNKNQITWRRVFFKGPWIRVRYEEQIKKIDLNKKDKQDEWINDNKTASTTSIYSE